MSNSLRDQLLGLGFKPVPKPERKRPADKHVPGGRNQRPARASSGPRDGEPLQQEPQRRHGALSGKPAQPPHGAHKPSAGMNLGKAWAIRAQQEKAERIEAEQLKQEQARQRRQARARLERMLEGNVLNDPSADIARHFPYGGKIKRIYVNADQLKALNAGQLGVIQLNGRYLLVTVEVLEQAEVIFPPAIALKVDPDAPSQDDFDADPKYQVPDDLVW